MTTQRVSASYQEIIDLHTESDKVSILGFHTPSNDEPIKLLRPFWDAYQKVRYRGCSMSLVPAARLPADPSQVGYGAGEPPIDPRDLLNPILFHGCHGDDLGSILNQFYTGDVGTGTDIDRFFSDSMDHNIIDTSRLGDGAVYESLYYRALTDNTWLKAHPQRGFRKNMRPMVYRVAVNTQLNPNSNGGRQPLHSAGQLSTNKGVDEGERSAERTSTIGPVNNADANYLLTTPAPGLQTTTTSGGVRVSNPATYGGQQWMTPGIRPLGWMDTRQVTTGVGATVTVTGDSVSDTEEIASMYEVVNTRVCYIPKVFMGICMLPPAYRTEQYFRIVLNHHFDFAKYRGTSMRSNGQLGGVQNVVNMYNWDESKGGDDDGFEDDTKDVLYD